MLRQSRARAEAYSAELAAWEADTARARNEGTFFKGLFKADVLQGDREGRAAAVAAPSTSGVGYLGCLNLQENAMSQPQASPIAVLWKL